MDTLEDDVLRLIFVYCNVESIIATRGVCHVLLLSTVRIVSNHSHSFAKTWGNGIYSRRIDEYLSRKIVREPVTDSQILIEDAIRIEYDQVEDIRHVYISDKSMLHHLSLSRLPAAKNSIQLSSITEMWIDLVKYSTQLEVIKYAVEKIGCRIRSRTWKTAISNLSLNTLDWLLKCQYQPHPESMLNHIIKKKSSSNYLNVLRLRCLLTYIDIRGVDNEDSVEEHVKAAVLYMIKNGNTDMIECLMNYYQARGMMSWGWLSEINTDIRTYNTLRSFHIKYCSDTNLWNTK